jgi:hypothetical protein
MYPTTADCRTRILLALRVPTDDAPIPKRDYFFSTLHLSEESLPALRVDDRAPGSIGPLAQFPDESREVVRNSTQPHLGFALRAPSDSPESLRGIESSGA